MSQIKTVLFIGDQAALASSEETKLIMKTFGLKWQVNAISLANTTAEQVATAALVIVWDEQAFQAKFPNHVHFQKAAKQVPKEIAEQTIAILLGGGQEAPQPKVLPTAETKPAKAKNLGVARVSRETAGRKGKGVTVISDLKMSEDQLKEFATKLKNKCGSGGTAKDGRIEIQGDHRDMLVEYLNSLGYTAKRSGG